MHPPDLPPLLGRRPAGPCPGAPKCWISEESMTIHRKASGVDFQCSDVLEGKGDELLQKRFGLLSSVLFGTLQLLGGLWRAGKAAGDARRLEICRWRRNPRTSNHTRSQFGQHLNGFRMPEGQESHQRAVDLHRHNSNARFPPESRGRAPPTLSRSRSLRCSSVVAVGVQPKSSFDVIAQLEAGGMIPDLTPTLGRAGGVARTIPVLRQGCCHWRTWRCLCGRCGTS